MERYCYGFNLVCFMFYVCEKEKQNTLINLQILVLETYALQKYLVNNKTVKY